MEKPVIPSQTWKVTSNAPNLQWSIPTGQERWHIRRKTAKYNLHWRSVNIHWLSIKCSSYRSNQILIGPLSEGIFHIFLFISQDIRIHLGTRRVLEYPRIFLHVIAPIVPLIARVLRVLLQRGSDLHRYSASRALSHTRGKFQSSCNTIGVTIFEYTVSCAPRNVEEASERVNGRDRTSQTRSSSNYQSAVQSIVLSRQGHSSSGTRLTIITAQSLMTIHFYEHGWK